jgi:hypothetical protein
MSQLRVRIHVDPILEDRMAAPVAPLFSFDGTVGSIDHAILELEALAGMLKLWRGYAERRAAREESPPRVTDRDPGSTS